VFSHVQPSSQVCISPFIIYFNIVPCLFSLGTHFHFTLHIIFTLPSSYTLSSTSFYHVLNNTLQALVAVSSSGHIRISRLISISVHILTSRYRSHTAFAQFRFSTRDFPALRASIAPLFPRFRLLHASRIPPRVDTSGYSLSPLPLRDEHIAPHIFFPSTFISAAPSAELKILQWFNITRL
jgi:hypothetical protein